MTRKPDGWVLQSGTGEILPHYFEDTKERCEARASNDFYEYAGEHERFDCVVIPVCLVPPALLDWVEEVEKYLKVTLDNCTRNGFDMLASEEKALLDKLREVRG